MKAATIQTSGRDQQRGQQVAYRYRLDLQQPKPDPKQEQPASRSDGCELRLRQRAANQHPSEREGALYHDEGHYRCHHADDQRSSEGDRGKAVQRCLQDELIGSAPKTVRQRAENGQWTHTEDQRGGNEALDEALPGGNV